MKDSLNNWKKYLYCIWLGGSAVACFDTSILDWRFWVVTLPTVIAVTFINENQSDCI